MTDWFWRYDRTGKPHFTGFRFAASDWSLAANLMVFCLLSFIPEQGVIKQFFPDKFLPIASRQLPATSIQQFCNQ